MYSAATWAMCFPHLFPYGDGVFGLPRQVPLTFQQVQFMLLLREELSYDVTPEMFKAAHIVEQSVDEVRGLAGPNSWARTSSILQATVKSGRFANPADP